MIYRSLVFDFDGTIADTLGETRRIYNQLAPDYGLRQVELSEIDEMRHFSLIELLDYLKIPKRKVPSLISKGTKIMRENISQLAMIKGMREMILELRPRADTFGILTSNSSDNVDQFLKTHGLRDEFDFISSTSRLTGKSRHLRGICTTFSLNPNHVLYIGDELRDIRASQKAGIKVAAVTWGFNSRQSLQAAEPDYLFESPNDFRSLLRS